MSSGFFFWGGDGSVLPGGGFSLHVDWLCEDRIRKDTGAPSSLCSGALRCGVPTWVVPLCPSGHTVGCLLVARLPVLCACRVRVVCLSDVVVFAPLVVAVERVVQALRRGRRRRPWWLMLLDLGESPWDGPFGDLFRSSLGLLFSVLLLEWSQPPLRGWRGSPV